MKRKLWVLFLGFVLFFVPLGRMARAGQAEAAEQSRLAKQTGLTGQTGQTEQTAKIKAEISRRIARDKARVKLKLRSGAEIKGRVDQAGNDDFTFTDEKSGQQMAVAYADVERVKGRGLSTGAKFGIIGGIVVGAVVIVLVKASRDFDPFKNGIPLRGIVLP